LAERIENRQMSAEFLSAWDAFLSKFGCRGPLEMDLASPRYADDPVLALWLNFSGKEKGDYLLYLDNVVVRRADGTIVELYRGGKLRRGPPAVVAGYSNISVEPVPVTAVQRSLSR